MKTKQQTLLFVYNANSTLFATVSDFVHKAISPKTYQCNLCKITYGNLRMNTEWRSYIQSIPIPVQFLHKDELRPKYPNLSKIHLPAVFVIEDNTQKLLISYSEINQIDNVKDLIELVKNKLQ